MSLKHPIAIANVLAIQQDEEFWNRSEFSDESDLEGHRFPLMFGD